MNVDLFGVHLSTIEPIMSQVKAIRPQLADINDGFPYLIYETSGLTELQQLNRKSTGWYEGSINVHVCAQQWQQVNAIAAAIKNNVPGTTAEDADYAITRIRYDDETDTAPAVDEHEIPYLVKIITFFVRARRE